ncbi:MAG: hypothetical protein JO024_01360 [Candidatus Eremiobacteraeota bacterium]|nr:hypothetical protein [Candidatus Eremiobacteraeota bacterium]MBV9736862.1 hypothetical protein [Candidatus Eremiobacteraeota bacterium]
MDITAFLDRFFAIAPWVLFAAIVLSVYFASRGSRGGVRVPIAQTFSCTQCGHRGKREHMVPISREGSIVWYCPRCAARL